MGQIKILTRSDYTGSDAWKNFQPPTQIQIDDIIAVGEDNAINEKIGSITVESEPVGVTVSTRAILFLKGFTYGNNYDGENYVNVQKYIVSTTQAFQEAAGESVQQLEDGVPVTAMPSTLEEINAKYNIRQAIVDTICGNNGSSVSLVPIVVDYVEQDTKYTAFPTKKPEPANIPPVEW